MITVFSILALAAVALVLLHERRLRMRHLRARERFYSQLEFFDRRPADSPASAEADSCSRGRISP